MRKSVLFIVLGLGLMALGLAGCGLQGTPDFSRAEHTPIPTLPKATMPPVEEALEQQAEQAGPATTPCRTTPVDVLVAWFDAGLPGPDGDPFTMTDLDGNTCQLTFDDVMYVFSSPGIWYENSPSCTSCHSGDPESALGQLSLDSYENITAKEETVGGGDWEASHLYDRLVVRKDMPLGRPADSPEKGLEIFVGQVVQE